jgi:serine/threonine protein kinase
MIRTPIESFLELTRKSGLVETNRFNSYLERLAEIESVPEDPKLLAQLLVRDAVLSKFQSEQLLSGKWRGFYVGKYRVIERIGIGGMGQVYLAEHRTMKRRYAIKVLPRSKSSDPAALERFEREARAGGSIDHTNIVRAYDKDQDGDLHYLVMDFIDGCSLSEIVRATGPLDVRRVGNYMYQTACGLKHAHESGLIHRDVKPANILVDRQGTVKILDMGLARFFNDQDDVITKKYDETVLGTADYLSPEQAIDSHNVDVRSDFYSMGCTYYYTLAGRPPFDEGSVAQKLIWHQTRAPKAIRELRPDVPPQLEAVLQRCMMKQAKDRYDTPEELIEVLSCYSGEQFIPSTGELPELSPIARGLPFGGELLSSPQVIVAAAVSTNGAPGSHGPPGKDGEPKSPIFDSQLVRRGGDDSTVSIRSEDSAEQRALPNNPTPPTSAAEEPTQPVMIAAARSAGIAPKAQAHQPIVLPSSPAAQPHWDPYPSPLPFSPLNPVKVEVFPATEYPSRIERRGQAGHQGDKVPAWMWWGISGLVVLALAVVIFFFWFRPKLPGNSSKPSGTTTLSGLAALEKIDTAPAPRLPRTWNVAKTKLDGIDCISIGEALRLAQPGDTILVTDRQVYEESLRLGPRASKLGLARITIKAEIGEDGKRAKLLPPPNHSAADPLVRIENLDQLTLSGFLLDGDGRTQTILELNGRCSGLVLENLRIEGFQTSGIVAQDFVAPGRQDARLENLWIRPRQADNRPVASALALQGKLCEGMQLRHCRLQGPYQSVIQIAAPAQRFLLEQCQLAQGRGRAVTWAESLPPRPRLAAVLQNNTFWDFETGLAIQAPLVAEDIQLVCRSNLFYQVKKVLQVDPALAKIKPETLSGGLTGPGNVFDQAGSGPGDAAKITSLGLRPLTFTLPTSNISAQEFLRYPAGGPLQTAGANQGPAGANE